MVATYLPLDAEQRAHAARVRREQPQHRAPPRVPCGRATRRAGTHGVLEGLQTMGMAGGRKGRGILGVR
jgi:hypothetical protein